MDRNFTILIAEDSLNDRKLLHLALQRNPRRVDIHEATDGTEVIDYLNGDGGKFENRARFPMPDLIILDLKMPRMDGLEVLRWLRNHPTFSRIPVVMLSGSGLEKDVDEAYRLGVHSYIQKPADFKDFVRKLGTLIDYWTMVQKPVVET
jgi:CheY-like chemotaxis protein